MLRNRTWHSAVLVPLWTPHRPLAPSTTKASRAAQVPSFSTGKLTQGVLSWLSDICCTALGYFCQPGIGFWERKQKMWENSTSLEHGKGKQKHLSWILTGNDKSRQRWLTEEYIYTWPVTCRLFWEYKELKKQEWIHLTDPRATVKLSVQRSWKLPGVRWLFCHWLATYSSLWVPHGVQGQEERWSIEGKNNKKSFGHQRMLTLALETRISRGKLENIPFF